MPMATYWLAMMAFIKQRSAFCNASIGLVWMLTSLPTFKPAIDVKFDALMTAHRLPCFPACPSQPNLTSVSTLTFLDP